MCCCFVVLVSVYLCYIKVILFVLYLLLVLVRQLINKQLLELNCCSYIYDTI
jgi:hypothetical protein